MVPVVHLDILTGGGKAPRRTFCSVFSFSRKFYEKSPFTMDGSGDLRSVAVIGFFFCTMWSNLLLHWIFCRTW